MIVNLPATSHSTATTAAATSTAVSTTTTRAVHGRETAIFLGVVLIEVMWVIGAAESLRRRLQELHKKMLVKETFNITYSAHFQGKKQIKHESNNSFVN